MMTYGNCCHKKPTKAEEGLPTSDFRLPTSNFQLPTSENEMIKSSLNELMPVYLKLFNTVLDLGTMPQMWCDGLITPIFKCGK